MSCRSRLKHPPGWGSPTRLRSSDLCFPSLASIYPWRPTSCSQHAVYEPQCLYQRNSTNGLLSDVEAPAFFVAVDMLPTGQSVLLILAESSVEFFFQRCVNHDDNKLHIIIIIIILLFIIIIYYYLLLLLLFYYYY